MKESIRRRLERSFERFEELSALLADPDVIGEPTRFRDLSVEYARLEPVAERFRALRSLETERDYARELLRGADASLRELAQTELEQLDGRIESEGLELTRLLVPRDPRDDSNIFLEIRAGTGGDEAAIFAGDLFRMYARYAERQGWRVEVLS
jgi:peptide chain release factor 1